VNEADGPDTLASAGGSDCAVLYKGQCLSPVADSLSAKALASAGALIASCFTGLVRCDAEL
jgi:hypothetical protein